MSLSGKDSGKRAKGKDSIDDCPSLWRERSQVRKVEGEYWGAQRILYDQKGRVAKPGIEGTRKLSPSLLRSRPF